MRTDFIRYPKMVVGSVRLVDGVAVLDDTVANVADTVITDANGLVTPQDGARYLRALPRTFRPPYFYAVFVEEGD